ncbi:MAG TPA: DUF99 family protein [Thermoplasmata archaeon]|nr:DUF99 family protein [Thermoplasmata archaeon]
MGRALSKRHLRVIGLDDGPFTRRHRYAEVVAVAMSVPGTVEGISATRVRVDGTDATERIASLLSDSPYLAGTRAVLVDGITVAGFNVLDLERIGEVLGKPVISVTRRAPDLPAIRSAIWKYFPDDARRRWGLIQARRLFPLSIEGSRRWVAVVGGTRAQAVELLRRTTLVGAWPEPLRLAHLLARAMRGGRPRAHV